LNFHHIYSSTFRESTQVYIPIQLHMLINKEKPEIASNAHLNFFSVADVVNVLYSIWYCKWTLVLICKGNEVSIAGLNEWAFYLLYKGILTKLECCIPIDPWMAPKVQ
jgi:hypothetical protein